jgi:hypothetical protein
MKKIKQILITISILLIVMVNIDVAQPQTLPRRTTNVQGPGWPHWGRFPRINPYSLAEAKKWLGEPWVNVDPENKQQVLDSLQSPNLVVRRYVISYCGYAQIREALPVFKILFAQHPEVFNPEFRSLSERSTILDAVTLLEDSSFQQEFRMGIDSLRNYPDLNWQMISFAGYLMDKHNDDYGFNFILPYYTNPDSIKKYKPLSSYLMLFVNKHREEIINALKFCVSHHPKDYERKGILRDLYNLGYPEIESIAYEFAESDTSENVRDEARLIIKRVNRSLFEKMLIEALQIETSATGRDNIYTELGLIGKLWSYKILADIYVSNRDSQNSVNLEYHLENEYHLRHGLSTPLLEIDTLKSNVTQMLSFGWLGDYGFAIELNDILNNAQSFLFAGDSVKCARQVKLFQSRVNEEYRDTLDNDGKFITVFGWKFLYGKARWLLYCLPQIPPDPSIGSISPANVYVGSSAFTLTVNGKNFAGGSTVNWNGASRTTTFISDSVLQANISASDIAAIDSPLVTVKSADGMAESNGIRFYIKQQPAITGCSVKLVNSTGTKLTGGTLQYYDGSWKDAVNNNDGTFFVNTTKTTLSLRMTYEYGTQTKSNITVGPDTVVFQTVNAQVQLQNSSGTLIDIGTVQYYAGAWRNLGTTTNGIATKDLLPNTYSFRMTYAHASKDKQQDIGTNATVVFQTVNTAVQLQNSQGTLMDQGTVQYYSGAWRDLGTTSNGVANKELLPNNYSFRMTYAYASKDKQQDLSTNPIVVFQTVNAVVQLKNSQGNLIDQGTVQYYSGAWRSLGATTNGTATKELLPNNYSFRMTHEHISVDKAQDISTNNTVSFSTVLCTIRVKNSQSQPVDGALASYYSGAWRQIGNTVNGEITKELLPVNLSFRVKYGTQQQDKQQNLSTNNIVEFAIQ